MTTTRPALDTSAELAEIAAVPAGLLRNQMIGDFLTRRAGLLRRVGMQVCRSNALGIDSSIDDVVSEVNMIALVMFEEMGADAGRFSNWEGMLTVRARNQMAERTSKVEFTGISGADAARRRHKLLYATQKVLAAEGGTTYEGQELVDLHNERMLATRSDAARQSVLCTVDDLIPIEVRGLGESDVGLPQFSVIDESESPLVPSEAVTLIRLTVEACYRRTDRLGQVAEMFLGLNKEPVTTRADIAEALGISGGLARRAVAEVREVAKTVLSEKFGITGI